jgi:UDP-4-amino-4,6-dideoxy-N-acetyl-beta-L-altrosamine N-acetyltransferase
MYSDHVISQQEHDAWFARALAEIPRLYLIFLYEGKPIGFVSFTNVSDANGRCYWAFYLGEADVPRGAGSVMEFFAIDYAFLTLKTRKLCCEVFSFNGGVIKLHEKFGFVQEGRFVDHYLKNGKYEDIVCLAKFGTNWIDERETFKSRLFGKVIN